MRELERRLGSITISDALLDAESEARAVVRPMMRTVVGAAADQWFLEQARNLRQLDGRLELLALRFSVISDRPLFANDDKSPLPSRRILTWLRGPADALSSAMKRVAGKVSDRPVPEAVRNGAGQLSAQIGHAIGVKIGAHEQLRAGGRAELTRIWLGPPIEGVALQPYLVQLLDAVDRTAAQAKEMLA